VKAWLFVAVLLLACGAAAAAESDPLPVPAQGARANAVRVYNEGVALLVQRNYPQAQKKFEAALAADETLAEAHNNLAYALRMQGKHNLGPSLAHYNRAIQLKPGLAQAYMYRGTLFVLQGDMASANRDLEKLRTLDPKLAGELDRIVKSAAEGDSRGGIAAQIEY
jgi:tetratricopeptide (TPR) repeat protein